MDHITEDCRTLLEDLTRNSKRVTDKFSELAWDNETEDKIVEAMEKHLRQVDEITNKYKYEVRKTQDQHFLGGKMYDPDVKVENNIPQTSEEPGTGGDTTDLNTQLAAFQIEPRVIEHSPEFIEALSKYNETGLAELENELILSVGKEENSKCFFNYLFLDPRVTTNLPSGMNSWGDEESFKDFVAAIFYVGKGQGDRPYVHLREAIKEMKTKVKMTRVSNKVKRIIDIWSKDVGVVLLYCFQNVISEEALTREACMIDAIDLNQLTNIKTGSHFGISTKWRLDKKMNMGIYFLKKALQIFKEEGEKQIFRDDFEQ